MAKALTQAVVINNLSAKLQISKKEVRSFLDLLTETIVSSERVAFPFGVFKRKVKPARPARKGKNPFTGEDMVFAARPKSTEIKFRASKRTREMLNNK